MLPLIPEPPRRRSKGGRPFISKIKPIADGIFYKLRTGCQWNAIPRCFGASSTIHLYFQRWVELGIFEKMWEVALEEYDDLVVVAWKHQSIDTSTVKSPHGGEKTGKNPMDRGKLGCKRSVLVDARGVPLSIEIAPANRHDSKLLRETLKKRKYRRKRTKQRRRLHLHGDKGYDSEESRTSARRHGYIPKIAKKRRKDRRGRPVIKRDPYRWLVESSHSWQNRFRSLKVRWEKKATNYLALMHLSFAIIALRAANVIG